MKTLVCSILLSIALCRLPGDECRANPPTAGSAGGTTTAVLAPTADVAASGRRFGLPWANGRFVYAFSPQVQQDAAKVAAFEAACHRLLQNTALACVPRAQAASDRDYVYVVSGTRDFSFVGRQGGKQLLSILIWNNPIIISHEIKHALGWGHEQQHPQRDRYVKILFDNIPPQSRENFAVFDNGNEGPYDFDSIMHYSPTDFAMPGRKAIRARPAFRQAQSLMGQRDHLSTTDIAEIRDFYGDPSVRWCGISRQPAGTLPPGCSYVCIHAADPSVGTWLPQGTCKPAGAAALAGGQPEPNTAVAVKIKSGVSERDFLSFSLVAAILLLFLGRSVMFRILFALGLLLSSMPLLADCNESALQGTWTVFYRDNAFPSSVLAADEKIDINYNAEYDEFSVEFSDNEWKAWDGAWSQACVDGRTVLIGAIQQRRGRTTLLIEMSRVIDPADLLARSNGVKRQQQINIHFPDRYAEDAAKAVFDALKGQGYVASHPGHAHADL